MIMIVIRSDGTYAVPNKDEWPICKIKTTTAKPRKNSPFTFYISKFQTSILNLDVQCKLALDIVKFNFSNCKCCKILHEVC